MGLRMHGLFFDSKHNIHYVWMIAIAPSCIASASSSNHTRGRALSTRWRPRGPWTQTKCEPVDQEEFRTRALHFTFKHKQDCHRRLDR